MQLHLPVVVVVSLALRLLHRPRRLPPSLASRWTHKPSRRSGPACHPSQLLKKSQRPLCCTWAATVVVTRALLPLPPPLLLHLLSACMYGAPQRPLLRVYLCASSNCRLLTSTLPRLRRSLSVSQQQQQPWRPHVPHALNSSPGAPLCAVSFHSLYGRMRWRGRMRLRHAA